MTARNPKPRVAFEAFEKTEWTFASEAEARAIVMEENEDRFCDCCLRVHRRLYLVDGYWLGKNCAEKYKIYRRNSDINSPAWRGWEKQHAKLTAMTHRQ